MENKYDFREGSYPLWRIVSFLTPDQLVPQYYQTFRVEGTDTIVRVCLATVDPDRYPSRECIRLPHHAILSDYYPKDYWMRHKVTNAEALVMSESELAALLKGLDDYAKECNAKAVKGDWICHLWAWQMLPTRLTDDEATRFAKLVREDVEDEDVEDEDVELEEYLSAYEMCDLRARDASRHRSFVDNGKNIWCSLLDMGSVHKVMAALRNEETPTE